MKRRDLKFTSARVFAPATVANVGCGFDIFGFALHEPGDELVLRVRAKKGVKITRIIGDKGLLPLQAEQNTAGQALLTMLDKLQADFGLEIELYKKMPVGSGLGSSAASSVAAVFALNILLKEPLPARELLPFAIEGEKIASGGVVHLDNVAPGLYGGFVLVRHKASFDIVSIPTPPDLYCAVVHPHIEIMTAETRKMLKSRIPLQEAITQWANVAGMVSALTTGDFALLRRSLHDVVAEPDRAVLIPHYQTIKRTALESGASGFGISGSGPSVFAFCKGKRQALKTARAMRAVLDKTGIENDVYISKINNEGAKVLAPLG